MEQNQDVYADWVVVSDGHKSYIGKQLICGPETSPARVVLEDAFELKTLEMHRPDQTGRGIEMVVQNMHVQESLCSEGVKLEIYVTRYRRLAWLSEQDRQQHINFIESAKRAFTAQRAKALGIELPRA